ncbi:MAG: hypothetical protein Q8L23_15930 [Caulobacter sp.]|nr:hypothetical protein [Caulobacter sp.]
MSADVAIRLGLKGGTEVERGLKAVGREGKAALRDLQAQAKGLPPHMVALSRGVAGVRDEVSNLASRAPGALGQIASSFGFLGTAIAGVTVGVGLLGAALVRGAVAAAQTGDEIEAMANKVGVSITALQQLRDAGLEADVEIGDMDAGLQRLNASLGAMKTGVGDAKLKEAFAELGFNAEQLQRFKDAGDFLPVMADRLAEIGDKADRVQLAKKLGVEELLPLLELGSVRLLELMQAASDAGRVLDPGLVEDLANTDRQLEKVDARLKVASTTFFSQFTPAVVWAKEAVVNFLMGSVLLPDTLAAGARAAADSVPGWKKLADILMRITGLQTVIAAFRPPNSGGLAPLDPNADWGEEDRRLEAQSTPEAIAAWRAAHPRPAAGGGGGGGGGSGSAAAARKRAADEAARAAALKLQNEERLRAIDLENRLAMAEATANADLVKKLKEEIALYALIARYQAAGVDADQARLAAQILLRELRQMEAETLKVDANPEGFESSGDRMARAGAPDVAAATDWDAWREEFKTRFREGGLEALESGDIGQALANQVEGAFVDGVARSLDRLADMLFDLFEQAMREGAQSAGQSGGGSGGFDLGSILSQVFAAVVGGPSGGGASTVSAHAAQMGRASGGPVYRGWSGAMHERGYERFTATSDGYVHDAATTARQLTDARARSMPSSARSGEGGPIAVTLIDRSAGGMRATASEQRQPDGSRGVNIELVDALDRRIETRVKGLTRGGADNADLARGFGLRPVLSGG